MCQYGSIYRYGNIIGMGNYTNKAEVVRKAIAKSQEDEAIEAVLRSERNVAEGKVFFGDLDEIAKKLKEK